MNAGVPGFITLRKVGVLGASSDIFAARRSSTSHSKQRQDQIGPSDRQTHRKPADSLRRVNPRSKPSLEHETLTGLLRTDIRRNTRVNRVAVPLYEQSVAHITMESADTQPFVTWLLLNQRAGAA